MSALFQENFYGWVFIINAEVEADKIRTIHAFEELSSFIHIQTYFTFREA